MKIINCELTALAADGPIADFAKAYPVIENRHLSMIYRMAGSYYFKIFKITNFIKLLIRSLLTMLKNTVNGM